MYIIVWRYHVNLDYLKEFKIHYAHNGVWSQLFQRDPNYLGTSFAKHPDDPQLFYTIDRWVNEQSFTEFHGRFKAMYDRLDNQCNSLTQDEEKISEFTL